LVLKCHAFRVTVQDVKMLSIEEAQARFAAVCEEALAGEVIQLQSANGALLQLVAVPSAPAFPDQKLAECYDDEEWAAFENRCAKASD